jgi:hypothetical protein
MLDRMWRMPNGSVRLIGHCLAATWATGMGKHGFCSLLLSHESLCMLYGCAVPAVHVLLMASRLQAVYQRAIIWIVRLPMQFFSFL